MEGEARHHRIEVHHAERLAGPLVEEDVRDLGVVVGGAHRDLPTGRGKGEGRGQGPPVEERLDLGAAGGGARHAVRRDRPLEGREPRRRVVEGHDRLVERRGRQVLELGQEASEGAGRLAGLGFGGRRSVERVPSSHGTRRQVSPASSR